MELNDLFESPASPLVAQAAIESPAGSQKR